MQTNSFRSDFSIVIRLTACRNKMLPAVVTVSPKEAVRIIYSETVFTTICSVVSKAMNGIDTLRETVLFYCFNSLNFVLKQSCGSLVYEYSEHYCPARCSYCNYIPYAYASLNSTQASPLCFHTYNIINVQYILLNFMKITRVSFKGSSRF